jgi:hypothetical protein
MPIQVFISHSSLFLIPGATRCSYWHDLGRCSTDIHRPKVFALQKCGNFCFEQNFERNSKTKPRWSNLISPAPQCSANHGQADLRTPLLIFELSDPASDGFLVRRTAWQRPHDELPASGWTLATHNTNTKKPKRHFRMANFVRSSLIGRSAAQRWSRLSHRPSAAPLSDTSV